MIAAVTTTVLTLGLAYKINHPEFNFQQFVPVENLNVTGLDNLLDTAANKTQNLLTRSGSAEEDPKKKKRAEKKIEPTIDDKPIPMEPEKPKEIVVETQALAVKPKAPERRPPLCNIPLAYLAHRRCWRLARQNPVFNLAGLVESMMQ